MYLRLRKTNLHCKMKIIGWELNMLRAKLDKCLEILPKARQTSTKLTAEKGMILLSGWETQTFLFLYRKVTICKTDTDTSKPVKVSAEEEDVKTTLEFSSADSLESSVSLVSAGISQSIVSQKTDRTPSSASSSEVTEVRVNHYYLHIIYILSINYLRIIYALSRWLLTLSAAHGRSGSRTGGWRSGTATATGRRSAATRAWWAERR